MDDNSTIINQECNQLNYETNFDTQKSIDSELLANKNLATDNFQSLTEQCVSVTNLSYSFSKIIFKFV